MIAAAFFDTVVQCRESNVSKKIPDLRRKCDTLCRAKNHSNCLLLRVDCCAADDVLYECHNLPQIDYNRHTTWASKSFLRALSYRKRKAFFLRHLHLTKWCLPMPCQYSFFLLANQTCFVFLRQRLSKIKIVYLPFSCGKKKQKRSVKI